MTQHSTTILDKISVGGTDEQSQGLTEFIPADAPFDDEQRNWLNGLFTGLFTIANEAAKGTQEEAPGTALQILFGSQSGTAESLSKDLRKFAKTKGFDASVAELDSIAPADLATSNHVLIIAATFGEGEPTDNAKNFHDALMSDDAPRFSETVNFSVCGLGDSSYPQFNNVAREIDARLSELGANRVHELVACDVAYDDDYAGWKEAVFQTEAFVLAAGAAQAADPEESGPAFDKNHPFIATLLDRRCLNEPGSAKTVNHIELSLAGGGEDLDYSVGDALGLWPVNDAADVEALLDAGGFTGRESVSLKSGPTKLRAALLTRLDIVTVTPNTLQNWQVERPFDDAHIVDLLQAGVDGLSAQMLVEGLRPLQPRLYSISSSPKKHNGEVHLTVGEVHYRLNGTDRKGVASTYLGSRLQPGGNVGVYIQRSSHFHLPEDDTLPVIMIGPGTGIAPFRAFLEEREMRQANGQNWLFFGDQHEATDFLYRDEIGTWQENGLLTKASLAWSRDGAEKVYVQHLIESEGAAFFEWLEAGAVIYVCGDASRMANDVDQAIRRVIATHGNRTESEAGAYLDALSKAHRYQRDVY
ncbi:diflavin oxidoreductase [Roseibium aggregatum]|uniref:assimilatory sulfite reductase (NADPH) n=1 Tax=Roseibium aggregatum TaxID=187304 RepID=A0A939E9V9_9HYPH|nr:flavodoxin domain-containing protein [Roseibium aggregatum]MBN9669260.1 flavodoxin domain-containing protein [Roseibium aggregatum]